MRAARPRPPPPSASISLGSRLGCVLLALPLAACGAGDSQRPTDFTVGWALLLDGYVANAIVNGGSGEQAFDAPPVQVGDTAGSPGATCRALYAYDLAPPPPGFLVKRALLRVVQYDVLGLPYAALGSLLVDHVEIGAGIDTGDFAGGTIAADVGVLSSSEDLGVKELDVTAQVQADVAAGRTASAFRLHFAANEDGTSAANLAFLADSADSAGFLVRPELLVTYDLFP